ncbi:hypothetical protein Tco_1239683 [Tanacetum coccineum]
MDSDVIAWIENIEMFEKFKMDSRKAVLDKVITWSEHTELNDHVKKWIDGKINQEKAEIDEQIKKWNSSGEVAAEPANPQKAALDKVIAWSEHAELDEHVKEWIDDKINEEKDEMDEQVKRISVYEKKMIDEKKLRDAISEYKEYRRMNYEADEILKKYEVEQIRKKYEARNSAARDAQTANPQSASAKSIRSGEVAAEPANPQ